MQPVPQTEPSEIQGGSQPQSPPRFKNCVNGIFIFGNFFCSGLAMAAGILGIKSVNSVSDTSIVVVGLYLILFAAILVGYELSQFKAGTVLDFTMKKNLGFLYGPFGKSIYIIFMGFLAFGITSPQNLAIATGVLVGFWGLVQLAIAYWKPSYFDKKEKYVPQY